MSAIYRLVIREVEPGDIQAVTHPFEDLALYQRETEGNTPKFIYAKLPLVVAADMVVTDDDCRMSNEDNFFIEGWQTKLNLTVNARM